MPIALKIWDRVPCHSGPLTAALARSSPSAMALRGVEPEAMAEKTPPRIPARSKTMFLSVPKVLAAFWMALSISPDSVLAWTQFWKL